MSRQWRIGTRDSQLAIWQASWVKNLLTQNGTGTTLVPIKSEGDIDLVTPLYEMGVQGIFTKALDIALLKGEIDIAVHSMKDVPTQLAKGLVQVAVLPRAGYEDVLVLNHTLAENSCDERIGNEEGFTALQHSLVIATSSVRRRAQWLHHFPEHQLESLRGNVNSRLQKVYNSRWNGAIFAKAGLERIGILPANAVTLKWMLPAPAQGAVVVVAREDNEELSQILRQLNDDATALCTRIERDFLRTLLGGCTTPISALAQVKDGHLSFTGQLMSPDGREKIEVKRWLPVASAMHTGLDSAEEVLKKGGASIIEQIKALG
ncbi:MAG TPA: hydroxymethylbilane synthase [Sediminibacterium sp.]|nr:hydroxymethylbilane synthase [Sediminibacterium sp.]